MCAIDSISPTVSFNSIDVIFSWFRHRFDSTCFVFTRNSLFESEQNVQLSIFDCLLIFQLATGESGRITVTISDFMASCELHSIHRPSIWKAFIHFHNEMSLKVGKPWKWSLWTVWTLQEIPSCSPSSTCSIAVYSCKIMTILPNKPKKVGLKDRAEQRELRDRASAQGSS